MLGGLITSGGVEGTARTAYDVGYHVTLAIDATTDRDPDAHHHSLTKIFPRLGKTGTTAEIRDARGSAISASPVQHAASTDAA